MKNKWDQEVVNSQEDEDGFSLNPAGVFQYESAGEKQENNSNRNSVNTGPGSMKLAMTSIGARSRISELILSSSADLQSNR
jgi:hypothetical protein